MARYAEEAVASENSVHKLLKFLPGKVLEEEQWIWGQPPRRICHSLRHRLRNMSMFKSQQEWEQLHRTMPEILMILLMDEPHPLRTWYLHQSFSLSPSPDESAPHLSSIPTTSLQKLWSPSSFWHPLLASRDSSTTASFSCTSPRPFHLLFISQLSFPHQMLQWDPHQIFT